MNDIFTKDTVTSKPDKNILIILFLVLTTLVLSIKYSSLQLKYNDLKSYSQNYKLKEQELKNQFHKYDIQTFVYINELKTEIYNLSNECTSFMTDDEVADYLDFIESKSERKIDSEKSSK